jgi:hypothetical protein
MLRVRYPTRTRHKSELDLYALSMLYLGISKEIGYGK